MSTPHSRDPLAVDHVRLTRCADALILSRQHGDSTQQFDARTKDFTLTELNAASDFLRRIGLLDAFKAKLKGGL
jgi:hypothetical protein